MRPMRFSAVSPRRQQLIRMCQALNYGSIRNFRLENGDPVLESATVLAEERLDLPEDQRLEIGLADFQLDGEWCRLLARFDEIRNGAIERLAVLAGIPRRVVFTSHVPSGAAVTSPVPRHSVTTK